MLTTELFKCIYDLHVSKDRRTLENYRK